MILIFMTQNLITFIFSNNIIYSFNSTKDFYIQSTFQSIVISQFYILPYNVKVRRRTYFLFVSFFVLSSFECSLGIILSLRILSFLLPDLLLFLFFFLSKFLYSCSHVMLTGNKNYSNIDGKKIINKISMLSSYKKNIQLSNNLSSDITCQISDHQYTIIQRITQDL